MDITYGYSALWVPSGSYLRISGTLWEPSGSSLEALWGLGGHWATLGILRQNVLKHVCFSIVNEKNDHST